MENCLKVVVLGGESAGKSSLILVKTKHKFPHRRVPRLADPTIVRTRIDGKSYTFSVWDTKKIELCEQLQSPGPSQTTDVFILCFAVDNRQAFHTLTHKWLPQLKTRFPFVPVVLVACKTDLRSYPSTLDGANHVTSEEGNTVAEQHGSLYCETSALLAEGVTECFNQAVRYADLNLDKRDTPASLCSCLPSRAPPYRHVHMVKPPDIPPDFEILSSTFAAEWLETLRDGRHNDVTCVLQGREFSAHQVILCSASGFFCRLFKTGTVFTDIPSPVMSIARDTKSRRFRIHMDKCISPEVFKPFLEFLYTGSVSTVKKEKEKRELAMNLINLARMFELIELKSICENILNEREFLNPSVSSFLCDRNGGRLKELFLNSLDTSDVVFIVKGKRLYANRSVLSTRCDVMKRMFSGNFKESKSELTEIEIPHFSTESFLVFLDFLYSDHVNFEDADVFEVLKIADMYGQTRLLTLCEYSISKKAQYSSLRRRADTLLQVLLCVQPFNTVNLVNWCLYELSKNFEKVRTHKDYAKISEENRSVLEARGSGLGHKDQGLLSDDHPTYRKSCVIL